MSRKNPRATNLSIKDIWLADPEKLLSKEAQLAIIISKQLEIEGYYIESKTGVMNGDSCQKYRDICSSTHAGGFDLLVLHGDFIRTGIEIKPKLDLTTFQTAIGQCLVRIIMKKADRAIIFAEKAEGREIYPIIKRTMANIKADISVRTLVETIWEPNFLRND